MTLSAEVDSVHILQSCGALMGNAQHFARPLKLFVFINFFVLSDSIVFYCRLGDHGPPNHTNNESQHAQRMVKSVLTATTLDKTQHGEQEVMYTSINSGESHPPHVAHVGPVCNFRLATERWLSDTQGVRTQSCSSASSHWICGIVVVNAFPN